MRDYPMTPYHERIAYGFGTLSATAASATGAILATEDVVRWLCVTITASILMSMILSLVIKASDETIRIVTGRFLLGLVGGVLGTRYLLHTGWIEVVQGDMILLGAQASAVTIVSFLVGYPFLQLLAENQRSIARKFFGWLLKKTELEK